MLLLALLSSLALADDDAPPKWTVQVDPLTAALGFAHVQVERAFTDSFSAYLGPHVRLYDSLLADDVEPYLGFGAELGLRWFPWGGAPQGAWLQTRGVLAHLRTTEAPVETALGGYGSVLGGYTWILADRWVLAGGAGAQYIHYTVGGWGPEGIFPALHTAVGVAF
jgi:hypothetical protein